MHPDLDALLALHFDQATGRRRVLDAETIVHCHHYNARLQRTIESASAVDGKAIVVSTAEGVFAELLGRAFRSIDGAGDRRALATALYSTLGYGALADESLAEPTVVATHSHFVEGWGAGFPERRSPVCSFTEGYLQAALSLVEGTPVGVREVECMAAGAKVCRFAVTRDRTSPLATFPRVAPCACPPSLAGGMRSPTVDEEAIVAAVAKMPLVGNAQGLVPAFNVYLASVPADFYNLVSLRFVEEMAQKGLGRPAQAQLQHDAETCGINTFGGVISSPEWDALVGPMLREEQDALFGVVAVSNALGWGRWQIVSHEPAESLTLATANGYEASGQLAYRGRSAAPSCWMLTGVAAGLMALIYGAGSVRERFGQFHALEAGCRGTGAVACRHEVEVPE